MSPNISKISIPVLNLMIIPKFPSNVRALWEADYYKSNKLTTLRYLADKAGADEDAQITLTRYKGVKSVVSYKEYQEIIGKMVSIN